MANFSPIINRLITQLGHLPGIGAKTAQRLAFHILSLPEEQALELANAIIDAKHDTCLCSICCNITDHDPCEICSDANRDHSLVCVVEHPRNIAAIERTQEYRGLYHVLHGSINPMQDLGPENLKIMELLRRLQNDKEISEVIVATNTTLEGEATALYIARLLQNSGIKVTRPAAGLPMGGDLEYTDEITLARAMEGRREIN